tara:strand:- start:3185 stop:5068 length:1884 start_codon:yes stop_codon:yes gene_type:complete
MTIQEEINQIHSRYPWASEATLSKISANAKTDVSSLTKALKDLTGHDFNYDTIKKEFEDAEDTFKKANKLAARVESGSKNLYAVTARDTSPLEATAELLKMGVGALSEGVDSITNFTQFLGPVGAATSWVASGVAKVGVAAVGVAAIYAKLITEQEKALRTIIDYGAVAGDMSQYTKMRDSLAGVGMSMQEMSLLMGDNKSVLSNMTDDLLSTTQQFVDFASNIESETSKTMGDFGYGVEQMTVRLLEETKLMYMTGKLEQFSQVTKEKIRKNFETSSAMTTFLAGKFGDQRSSLLAMRSEAMTNIDFMTAMSMNAEYIAEKYGENAAENVRNTGANLKMLFSTVLGPQFGEQTEQVFNNFLKDINIDASVLNNMPKEMINMLSTLGPDVSSQFTNLMEQAGTGQITQPELVMRVQELTKSISEATPRLGDDPMITQQNDLIAQARQAPEAFMDLTATQLDAGLASVKALTEVADKSIDAVDDARKGFRTLVTAITPGFSAGTIAIQGFEGALGLVVSAFELVGLIPTKTAHVSHATLTSARGNQTVSTGTGSARTGTPMIGPNSKKNNPVTGTSATKKVISTATRGKGFKGQFARIASLDNEISKELSYQKKIIEDTALAESINGE